ncbi:MAG: hypothetical protein WCD76_10340 [Pyrinomonadaceae bacterium]
MAARVPSTVKARADMRRRSRVGTSKVAGQDTLHTPSKIMEAKKTAKKKKNNARVVCRDGKEFWTTQKQFWQWVREGVVSHTGDAPLTGEFLREHEELLVVVSNTVLDLGRPNHMREALLSRRRGLGKR